MRLFEAVLVNSNAICRCKCCIRIITFVTVMYNSLLNNKIGIAI